jgi:hypothetical protein
LILFHQSCGGAQAHDLVVKNSANTASVALAKVLADLDEGKSGAQADLNALIDDMARLYRLELKAIDNANSAKYNNFLENHEAIVSADQFGQTRMQKMKSKAQDCQSDFQVLRTKETDEALNGWDNADEDGMSQDEGNELGGMAREYVSPSDAGAECLPALLGVCSKAQITDKVHGYDYDYSIHRTQEKEEEGAGSQGLERTQIKRHFVNDACPNVVGSSCETACPLPKYEHFIAGSNVMYTCGMDGNWEAQLKKYSKIKVFTHVSESELSEWAAFRGAEVDCSFCNSKWPKMLNLDVDLQDHDPIVTLQSYLNYRGIDCDVWNANFVTDDATDPDKINQLRTTADADGASLFIVTETGKLATAASLLKGTDYVEIPPHLCTADVQKKSGENGGGFLIPGKYNFKIRGGKKIMQRVYSDQICDGGTWSPGNYATMSSETGDWDGAICQEKLKTDKTSHGGAGCSEDIWSISYGNGHCWCVPKSAYNEVTEDCPSQSHGTSNTWKMAVGWIDAPATLHCNGTFEDHFGGRTDELTPAGSGLPRKFAKRNLDPKYGIADGWFFRAVNDDATEWEYIKQGMEGMPIEENEAEADGWSMDTILDTSMGKIHGPFGTNNVCQNCQVHKSFTMPEKATSCDISFRFMRQSTWDYEYGYFYVNDEKLWEKRGVRACSSYSWKQSKDLVNVAGAAAGDCFEDVTISSVPCAAGEVLKVGFASSINQAVSDESWAFTNFKLYITGAAGDVSALTIHHFNTEKGTVAAPNGISENFDWRFSAEQDGGSDCNAEKGDTYSHKTYAGHETLTEGCRTDLPIRAVMDPRVSHDKIVAWWKMETFDEKKWEWESIVENYDTGEMYKVDFVDKGDLKVAMGGEGSHDGYRSLEGNTDQGTKISWGNVVASTMTLCTTSMYTPGGRTGRIFRGGRSNWLHGHWSGYSRAVHYQHWNMHPYRVPAIRNVNDWVVLCATASNAETVYANKYDWQKNWKADDPGDTSQIDSHNYNRVYDWTWDQKELIVGRSGRSSSGSSTHEESGFRVSEVIAWNRGFDRAELELMMRYMMERLRGDAD